jgi:hypothetical protein
VTRGRPVFFVSVAAGGLVAGARFGIWSAPPLSSQFALQRRVWRTTYFESWKMIPIVCRIPERRRLTPWRMVTR